MSDWGDSLNQRRRGGGGRTVHHGDDVCGGEGSCVGARRNSCIIPIVENLRAGVFCSRLNPYMVKAVKKASTFGTLKKTDDSRGSWLWDS